MWIRNLMWILSLLILGNLNIGESAFLRCYKGSLDNYLVMHLSQPVLFEEPSCINRDLPTVLYTFGYKGKVSGPATTAMLSAYLATNKRNVILLDWEKEAQSGIMGTALSYVMFAMPNAKKIGIELGEALVRLNFTDIHLIGHSLGAQLVGQAGRTARQLGSAITRITGLDPARALHEGTFAVHRGLDRTCAKFVDIIHTSPSTYGTSQSTGTVDMWPNYGSVKQSGGVQPGCPTGSFEMFTPENLCSHDRSWRFFSEAIGNPTGFPASFAPDYDTWVTQDNSSLVIYLGDLVNTRARGNFFLTTDAGAPFARNRDGLKPDRTRRQRSTMSLLQRLLQTFS